MYMLFFGVLLGNETYEDGNSKTKLSFLFATYAYVFRIFVVVMIGVELFFVKASCVLWKTKGKI
jgi:hypothetical protein